MRPPFTAMHLYATGQINYKPLVLDAPPVHGRLSKGMVTDTSYKYYHAGEGKEKMIDDRTAVFYPVKGGWKCRLIDKKSRTGDETTVLDVPKTLDGLNTITPGDLNQPISYLNNERIINNNNAFVK